MTTAVTLAIIVVAVPFTAALAGLLIPVPAAGGRRRLAIGLGIGAATVCMGAAIWLASAVGDGVVNASRLWVRFGPLDVTVGLRFDRGLAYVVVGVCAVALAVQVYSVAYLHDDDRYPPYAAQISLFTAAMLAVVLSGDLIEMLVGWEAMGICSYLLIGHDRSLPEAPAAAVKAFVVTRFGDIGFLLGIALLGIRTGSFRIAPCSPRRTTAGSARHCSRPRACCSCSARSARARSSRCTRGSPTPWPARRRSRR